MKPHSLRLAVATVLFFGGKFVVAQTAREDGKAVYANYDLRDSQLPADADARAAIRARATGKIQVQATARTTAAMTDAKAALAARVPGLQLEMNPRGTAPEAIGAESASQFLTPESSAPIGETARSFVVEQAALFGLTNEQAQALIKFTDYRNPAGNMGWVEFRQEANGLPIFQAELRAGFTARGAIARTTGNLAPALDYASLPTKPTLMPAEAAVRAAETIGVSMKAKEIVANAKNEDARTTVLGHGPFVRPIRTQLLYFPIEPGVATLAYSMTLWEDVHAFYILIDAMDGTLLWRKDITDFQTQTATYSVYTDDSPAPWSPSGALPGSGLQAPGISRTTVTLIGNEPPNTFNNLGWITDGGNVTTGNNVNAGVDLVSPNGIDTGGQATGSPNRVFSFNYNPAPAGSDQPSTADSRNGAVTNLFYWTNVYHDRLYLLGFTEAARNFQTNNFGRGGSGNDPVLAEVQDYSGTNNANFNTPADGSSGRMQMYLFTGPTPQRDGALDGEVFLHELTHGTSNRLHNNGSGLTSQISGGMGEGWSDFYARGLLSSENEDVNGIYASGGYVTYKLSATFTDNYYYGIRRFPYAVKTNVGSNGRPHDPMTFGDIDFQQINALNDGAYPSSPVIGITANEVHNIGAIWCEMLLEVRARMITRLGWTVGNQRALQIVTDAMKLDVSSPTIVQARDSIIAADNAGFAGADVADIRSGFAARGVGAGSSVTGSTYLTVVESYYPSSVPGAITFSDSLGNNNGIAEAGEDLVFTIPLTNKLTVSDANIIATLGGYSASYGTLASNGTASQTFSYHVPTGTACGTVLQIPLIVKSDSGTGTFNVPVTVGSPTTNVSFSENFDGVVAPALPAGWTTTTTGLATATWKTVASPVIDSGNCAFAADISSAADASLVSPVIAIGGGSQQLTFKQRYTTETPYDGGALEISIAGGAFTDIQTAGGFFVQGGYGMSVTSQATGNPLISRRVWGGSITTTGTVVVNLPTAASGQNVQFRWRFGCDSSTSSTGWYMDSVKVSSTSYACASIDSDGDGIPDGYETLYGLNPNDPNDASLDSDGDGLSNLDEYRAGTDPTNASSSFRVDAVGRDSGNGAVTVSFPTVNGKLYRFEYKDNLTDASWTLLQDNVAGTGGSVPVIDASANGLAHRFYRAEVIFQ